MTADEGAAPSTGTAPSETHAAAKQVVELAAQRTARAAVHAVWPTPGGYGVLVACTHCRGMHAHRVGTVGVTMVRRGCCGGLYLLGGLA